MCTRACVRVLSLCPEAKEISEERFLVQELVPVFSSLFFTPAACRCLRVRRCGEVTGGEQPGPVEWSDQ